MSLVGLISLHAKRSVNNFSTSGVRNARLRLNVNGTKRPFRNVKHNMLGVRKLPMCHSSFNKVKAPADSRRHAGVSLKAARVLTVIGNCGKGRNLRRTIRVVRALLEGCARSSKNRVMFFRWLR